MNLPKLTENLNIHQSLPDKPTLTTEELKIAFDSAGNIIKDYLNDILTSAIDTGVEEEIATSTAGINNAILDLENTVNESISGIEADITNINNNLNVQNQAIKNQVNDLIKTQTFSSSFEIPAFTTKVQSMGTISVPNGYTLIGVVPYSSSSIYFLSSFDLYNSTVYGKVYNTENNSRTGTVTCKAVFLKNKLA